MQTKTVRISKKCHKTLKQISLDEERSVKNIVEELTKKYNSEKEKLNE